MDRQTFSDESFRIEDPRGLIVLGHLPHFGARQLRAAVDRHVAHGFAENHVRIRTVGTSLGEHALPIGDVGIGEFGSPLEEIVELEPRVLHGRVKAQ